MCFFAINPTTEQTLFNLYKFNLPMPITVNYIDKPYIDYTSNWVDKAFS